VASAGNPERRGGKHFQQLRGKDLARLPVLEPDYASFIRVEFPEPKVNLLSYNAVRVVALEAQAMSASSS
jgi:hypothetical protein